VLAMLESKGHDRENIVKMTASPVQVEVLEKHNEDVTGYADNTRNHRAAALVY